MDKEEVGMTLEDRINMQQLMDLKAAFNRADIDRGGTLDLHEFVLAFGGVLGRDMSKEQLTHLFMKIDANSDGTVDWDEFTNFMLLESQSSSGHNTTEGASKLIEVDPRNEPNPKHLHHSDMMDGILQLPKIERLFTYSRDGTVRVWKSDTLLHVKTIKVCESWVTSMTHFEVSNRIATSSTDRTISFYDASTEKFELVAQLTGLETSPLCLGTWNDQLREKLLVGDDCGNVAIYDTSRPGKESETIISATSYRSTYEKGRHTDWITKVAYFADLSLMISCSLDGTLKLSELGRRNAVTRTLGEAYGPFAPVKRGVYSFAWSSAAKVLASCGLERTIALWNPYSTVRSPKPLVLLMGHTASVQHVAMSEDGMELFSCGIDKCIKVWDMRSHKCVQTLYDKTNYRPEDKISAMAYDGHHHRLLTGTTRLRPWPLVKAAKRNNAARHEAPLVAALYNANFHQVVSGDETAHVCVWDIEKGEMVFHFTELHDTKMTAMAFDEAGRRLITGANDGTVRVWNFSNGQMLQQLRNEGHTETSCLAFIVEGQNRLVLAGGWNRKVVVWRDEQTASAAPVEPDRIMSGHDEDILSIAYSPPNLLVTSGYDGRLLVWNMDSAVLKFKLAIPHVQKLDVDQRAMWKVLFLERRSQALVSGSADGKLRFWNVTEGLLVWEMHANHKNGEGVVALATEPTNSFLFSGDSTGYLKVWDISNFLNVTGIDQRSNVLEVAHWRAHGDRDLAVCIVTIEYVERHRLIMSGGSDGRIKLWRFDTSGVSYAGALGESTGVRWSLSDSSSWEPVELEGAKVPAVAPVTAPGGAPAAAGAKVPPLKIGKAVGRPAEKKVEDEDEAEDEGGPRDTHHLIQAILQGRGARKAQSSTQGVFRSLNTHSLAPISGTPRNNSGNSPRGRSLR